MMSKKGQLVTIIIILLTLVLLGAFFFAGLRALGYYESAESQKTLEDMAVTLDEMNKYETANMKITVDEESALVGFNPGKPALILVNQVPSGLTLIYTPVAVYGFNNLWCNTEKACLCIARYGKKNMFDTAVLKGEVEGESYKRKEFEVSKKDVTCKELDNTLFVQNTKLADTGYPSNPTSGYFLSEFQNGFILINQKPFYFKKTSQIWFYKDGNGITHFAFDKDYIEKLKSGQQNQPITAD